MDTSLFRRPPPAKAPLRVVARYLSALLASGLALGFSWPLRTWLERSPFAAFFVAACLVAWYAGLGPALVAMIAGWTLAVYYLLPPSGGFAVFPSELPLAIIYPLVTTGVVIVVCRLRRTNETLRHKESQLSDLLENASTGMHWLDESGRILWANKAQSELLGCSPGELAGRPVNEFYADAAAIQDILRRTAGNERLKNYEARLRAKDGSIKTVLLDSDLCFRDGQFLHAHFFVRDITARRIAEASQARIISLIEATSDLVGMATLEGRVLYLNGAGRMMLGLPLNGDLSHRHISEFHHQTSNDLLMREALPTVMRDGIWGGETTFLASDGREIPVSQVILAGKNRAGQVEFLSTIVRNITDRKHAEAALRASEKKYRELVEASMDVIWSLDRNGCSTFINAAVRRTYGYEPEEMLGRCFTEFSVPHGREKDLQAFARVLNGESLFGYETERVRRDGSILHLICNAIPMRDTQGNIVGATGTASDITEFKRAEEAVRKSEASLRLAQRVGRVGSWEADVRSGVIQWSDETFRIFGLSRREFAPDRDGFFALVYPEDRTAVQKAADEAIRDGNWYSIDYRVRRPDGSQHFVTQQAMVIRDETGQAVQLVGTVQDITERKQAEAAIQKLNAELEQRVARRTEQLEIANKELEAFSYSISHDLRAPLRAIGGFIEIIQDKHTSQLDAEGLRVFNVIASNAQRMNELIDDLLAFSRLTRQEFQRAEVDVGGLVQTVLAEVPPPKHQDPQPNIHVHVLPKVHGDSSMLRQVFANLVSNAVKFSRHSPDPLVEIGALPNHSEVVFFVRDNGVGFDMKYAPKLFQVFQRLHKAEQFEGTGVGLAIVQRIVQRHGGRVWAEASPDRGATFYFSLPRQNGHVDK